MARLGDIFEITSGGTPDRSKTEYYSGGTIPWIKTGDLKGKYVSKEIDHITPEGLNNSSAKLFPVNTVLVAMYGATIGACSILPYEAATNQACAAFLPNEKVLSEYLYYYLCGKKEKFIKDGVGGAQPNISAGYLKKVDFRIVTLNKQKEIIALLSKLDNIITLRQKQLQKLDDLVKARFVEMFGDPELNPFGWERHLLSEIIVNANNGMARRGNDDEGSIVMRLVELQDGFIDYSAPNRIMLDENEKRRYRLVDNDFLFARVNGNPENVGRCAVFHEIGEPVYHNDHIIRVHFNETMLDGTFASALINSAYGKRQMKSQIKTSAGQYTISQDGIGTIVAIIPPIHLQRQFAAFVSRVDKSKLSIQQGLEKLETLKKSLMQQYFG